MLPMHADGQASGEHKGEQATNGAPRKHSLSSSRRPSLLPFSARIWFLTDVGARSEGVATEPFSFLCPLVLLRPQDKIILPGKHNQTVDFVEFLYENANLKKEQIIWHEHNTNNALNPAGVAALVKKTLEGTDATASHILLTSWTTKEQTKFSTAAKEQNLPSLEVLGMDDRTSRVLYRDAKDADKPALLEPHIDSISGVRLQDGYICSTTNQLLIAYRLLGAANVTIKPIKPSVPSLEVSSAQELRLYDFPHGAVTLRKQVEPDRTADGFPIIATQTFLWGAELGELTEQLMVGTRKAGMRPCTGPASFIDKAREVAKSIVEIIQSTGPCTIEFDCVEGNPVLSDITLGRFSYEHFAKLFFDMYANAKKYMCLSLVPPRHLDIWTFWGRLMDQHAAFNTTNSPVGVFPLLYLRGTAGTFIVMGDTDEDIEKMRVVLEQALLEPSDETEVEPEVLDPAARRIWCFGPRAESTLQGQRYNLPSRFLSIVRPDRDVMILPGNHVPTQEFVDFCAQLVGFNPEQIIYTKGESFCLDDDIDEHVVDQLKRLVASNPNDKFLLVPYIATDNFYRWANQLKDLDVGIYGEDSDWISKYGHKGLLHRHMSNLDQPSVLELIDSKIRIAKGYTCSTTQQLLEAYRLIGAKEVVIKPILGSAGDGIIFVSDEEVLRLYGFPQGDVVLEEKLVLDTASDGIVLSPAVHYMKGQLVGEEVVDQIMVGVKYMGWRESAVSTTFKKTALRYAHKLIQAMQPQGPGGFDFLSVGGLPVLSDINTGRFNGAHQPKLFFEMYAPEGSRWYCWKFKPPENLDVHTFWRRLQERCIAFVPGKSQSGVFPLTYLRGSHGTFIAIGANAARCINLYESASRCLTVKFAAGSARRPNRNISPLAPAQPDSLSCLNMVLLKNATIYAPELLETRNLLLAGSQIVGIVDDAHARNLEHVLERTGGLVIDVASDIVVPGFIDIHLHLAGGGGEMGFASKTPEANLSDLVNGGLTTVFGVLGTDSITRSVESLLAKVEALNEEGITAFMFTGAYRYPCPTVTGSVMKDVAFIKPVLGVGEIAVSDHRGSQVTGADLATLASEARVGGLVSGKPGVVYCHIGPGATRLKPLRDAVENSDIPITQFLPTHISRSPELLEEGIAWVEAGGYIDLTARDAAARRYLTMLRNRGVNMDHVIASSDAFGSLPTFNDKGELIRYRAADANALVRLVKKMYFEEMWSLETVLPLVTTTPATYFKLNNKGRIEVGKDADILILDRVNLDLKYVFGKGQVLKTPDWTKRAMFES